MEQINYCPKVFISYSWAVSEKVLELAERLMANGVNVVLDKWDLKPGHDKYAFMEQSVNDASVNKVLIICDRTYAEKANQRAGGVGDETAIISPEIYGNVEQEKFIPIIFEKDELGKTYLPHYMATRIYIDLSTDDLYGEQYDKLLRNIHNKPQYTKPAIGKTPEWLDNEAADYSSLREIIKQLRNGNLDNLERINRVVKRAESEIVELLAGIRPKENLPPSDALIDLIDNSKVLRDLILDYLEEALLSKANFADVATSLFEKLYNVAHANRPNNYADEYLTEFLEFLIWELFICVTTLCLHYDKYNELRAILTHSYFINNKYAAQVEPMNYSAFQACCERIEYECKPKCDEPNLYTLQGRMLTRREKFPIYSMSAICNADILLCQLFPIMSSIESHSRWFPTAYIYFKGKQDVWVKLKSKHQCGKLYSLFNVNSIETLKASIKSCDDGLNQKGYSGFASDIKRISYSILLQDIGTIN